MLLVVNVITLDSEHELHHLFTMFMPKSKSPYCDGYNCKC